MGVLVNGQWRDSWHDTKSTGGQFVRTSPGFRHWVTADGGAGPSGEAGFRAEPGRYHLYVSLACPWAHRALLLRTLKGLDDVVSLSVVHPIVDDNGWTFASGDGVVPDFVNQVTNLYEIYALAKSDYTGRVTVPVLWDKQRQTIVSNESAEIIRMFNSAFDGVGALPGDYYPHALRRQIDSLNAQIYENVNDGVYRAGFATRQAAYDDAIDHLFVCLDELEARLSEQRYLIAASVTEADWRLFTTLLRFDVVYHGHFKCNRRRIVDYPALWGYLRDLYQQPGVAKTVNLDHVTRHYYGSHVSINPTRIVPTGPELDLTSAHGRENLSPV